jgi:hypothetical protein
VRLRVESLVLAMCVALAGCAGMGSLFEGGAGPATPPTFRDPSLNASGAAAVVVPGQSTKGQVAALLGPAESFRFDSGYEVWAWRGKPAKAATSQPEVVVLFSPDGVARKVRVRLAASESR